MKILHTSDWHLGQRFFQYDRDEEQEAALSQLRDIIIEEGVALLLVSGDIFDTGNPSFNARRIYYKFLTSLQGTCCRNIIITGGNHDAPGMLEAPKALLETLNIFVVGAITDDPKEVVLPVYDQAGHLEAVVAAVPFLRDKDLKFSVAGQTGSERVAQLKRLLAEYFEQLGTLAMPFQSAGVPILAMGHLYASGAFTSEKQDNIYIGDVENIEASAFPAIFSYVALGHIHRAQKVGGMEHVRYAGSLIPLSFSETKDEKGVYLLEYAGAKLTGIKFRALQHLRRLKTIEGTPEDILQKLKHFVDRHPDELKPWVELIVYTDKVAANLDGTLKEEARNWSVDILKIRIPSSAYMDDSEAITQEQLLDLTPLEVFQRRCTVGDKQPDNMKELETTFKELLEWMEGRKHQPQN